MESPRLRLIYLAGLRGLLKPDYTYGISSVIRQELMLRGMVREMQGDIFMARSQIEAACAPGDTLKQAFYRSAVGYLLQGESLRNMEPARVAREKTLDKREEKKIREYAEAFKILQKTNFYSKMHEVLKNN